MNHILVWFYFIDINLFESNVKRILTGPGGPRKRIVEFDFKWKHVCRTLAVSSSNFASWWPTTDCGTSAITSLVFEAADNCSSSLESSCGLRNSSFSIATGRCSTYSRWISYNILIRNFRCLLVVESVNQLHIQCYAIIFSFFFTSVNSSSSRSRCRNRSGRTSRTSTNKRNVYNFIISPICVCFTSTVVLGVRLKTTFF